MDPQMRLAEAIRKVCWNASEYGTDDEGAITHYLLPASTVHRLVGAAQSAGISASLRNESYAPAKESPIDLLIDAVDAVRDEVQHDESIDYVAIDISQPWRSKAETALLALFKAQSAALESRAF